jgi:hypothetical protein
MIKKLVGSVLVAGVLLSAASVSASTEIFPGVKSNKVTRELLEVKGASAKYLNYQKAIKDGYEPEGGFVYVPGLGGMGVHFVNVGLMDSKVDPKKPEVLLYEPTSDGGYKLIGVEYTVPAEYTKKAPKIFGEKFDGPMDNHDGSPGQHYDLHVWVWEKNPSGTFAQFNPNVTGQE